MKHPKIGQPVILKQARAVFIANQSDPWPTGAGLEKLLQTTDWAFISLPGDHDDIWKQPEHYVEIIKHYTAGHSG